MSSIFIISISRSGSTVPSTCIKSLFSYIRTTSAIASVSRICERKALPRPSPADAPLTSPAISTNSTIAGINFLEPEILDKTSSRTSGTGTIPTDGSIVQNG